MPEHWHFLTSGAQAPAHNMAMDESLLESAARRGVPVLRSYGWTEPAATFGYSQHYREVATWTDLRPLIRRPTGGGLVPHDADWTYSLVLPPIHPWYELKAVESYQRVHEWLQRAFAHLGLPSRLAPSRQIAAPGQCFVGAEKFDLLLGGMKVAGAAQRRTRSGLLIQGSIQPRPPGLGREKWETAMLETVPVPETVVWAALTPEFRLCDRAEKLAAQKYSQTSYNERR